MRDLTEENFREMEKIFYESVGGRYELKPNEGLELNSRAFKGILKGDIDPLIKLLSTPAVLEARVKCILVNLLIDNSPTEQRLVLKKSANLANKSDSDAEKFAKEIPLIEIGHKAIGFGRYEKGQSEAAIVATQEYYAKERGVNLKRTKVNDACKLAKEYQVKIDI